LGGGLLAPGSRPACCEFWWRLRYQSGGRLVMDVQGLFWKLEYVGIGAGYFWSDRFSGWTIGAEISFAF
jgi:hypothetical protein